MNRVLGWLGAPPLRELGVHDAMLAVLAASVAALCAVTVVFALLVLVLRARHVRARRRAAASEARWHDVLLEVLSGAASPAALHAHVRRGDELPFLGFLLHFVRRLRGAEAEAVRQVAAPMLDHLLPRLRSGVPEVRARAVQTLVAIGMPAHAERVVAALDDPSPFVALTAAHGLARREHAHYAAEIVQRLWRFTHWSESFLSAMLARIGPAAAAPARALLADAAQPENVRVVAAEVLRRLNDPHAVDVAAAALASGAGAAVQASALRVLAQLGQDRHLPAARRLLHHESAAVRAEATAAVGALGTAGDVTPLLAALEDASPWVAYEAARALLRLGARDLLRHSSEGDTPAALVARQVLAEGAG